MKTILALLGVLFVWLRVLPVVGRLIRSVAQVLRWVTTLLWQLARAVLAALVALPMLLNPEDVPRAYQPWSALDLTARPNPVLRMKLRAMALDPGICRAAVEGVGMRILPDRVQSDLCHIRQRVRLTRVGGAALAAVDTRCTIAARLFLWERHTLQPAARRELGAEVARIHHYSSFSCRRMRTSRGTSTRMSQHATANALDISGFTLTDGRRIMLTSHWDGDTPDARFLRAARDGLCDWFNVTLGPDYNRLHADHFHIDMGPFVTCR